MRHMSRWNWCSNLWTLWVCCVWYFYWSVCCSAQYFLSHLESVCNLNFLCKTYHSHVLQFVKYQCHLSSTHSVWWDKYLVCTNLYTVITNSSLLIAWAWIIIFISWILFICVEFLPLNVKGLFIPFQILTIRNRPKHRINPVHLIIVIIIGSTSLGGHWPPLFFFFCWGFITIIFTG